MPLRCDPSLQNRILASARQLSAVERQLDQIIDCLDQVPGTHARDIAGTLDTVRRDLLHDAIATLKTTAQSSPADFERQRRALDDLRMELLREVS